MPISFKYNLPFVDCWHLSDDHFISAALPLNLICCSDIFSWALIWEFCEFCGIGNPDGGHGNMSRGEAHMTEELFPSPRLFHTSAVGHRSVMNCTMALRLIMIPRCCGQLMYWWKTVFNGFCCGIIWLLLADVILKKKNVLHGCQCTWIMKNFVKIKSKLSQI